MVTGNSQRWSTTELQTSGMVLYADFFSYSVEVCLNPVVNEVLELSEGIKL